MAEYIYNISRGSYHNKIGRLMHKVLPQLRQKRHLIEHVYDPVLVSLGPYHHGRSELQQAEEFKPVCVRWLARGSEEKEKIFYDIIMENIDAIRTSYAETSILEQYDDSSLALMMLRDGCFITNFMANQIPMKRNNVSDWNSHFGVAALPFMVRDTMRLENQVPFLVIKLLISLEQELEELIRNYLIWLLLRDGSEEQVKIPREHEDPPLHFLEAVYRAITENETGKESSELGGITLSVEGKKKNDDCVVYHNRRMFRSVTELKAKGIHFSPSSSYCLKDVRFKSFSYYGELQLPVRYVSDQHQVMLSNFIAYELSPGNASRDYTVLSYAILMKSLIESPEDVKELQKKGILFNKYSNHEQVVEAFKDIDTLGLVHLDIFGDVKEKIGEHCTNNMKTWIPDLLHNQRWMIVALFSATLLLCLTVVQFN